MDQTRLPGAPGAIPARRAAVARDGGSHFLERHPYQAAVAALVLGLVAAGATGGRAPVEATLVAGAVGTGVLAALRAPFLGVVCAALLLAGGAIGDARVAAVDAPAGSLGEGLRVDAQAVLLEHPRPSPFGWSAEIELLEGPARGARLLARGSQDVDLPEGAAPGSGLQVSGFAEPLDAEPGADFDWAAHLRRRGVAGELRLEAVELGGGQRDGLAGAVDAMRSRAEEALAAGVEPPEAALVRGMVLGQDGEIDPLVRDDFRASGLAHLLAVSGQNVMLLGLLALPALAALGLGPRGRVVALLG
ncbi:MAG TPA: ComEC/Rec2 family competence protein, partial [Thermoleophilaceae bacterium]|nr:ComEC/Rec2 family competence protein [Thermoleophilaceae bacterium]